MGATVLRHHRTRCVVTPPYEVGTAHACVSQGGPWREGPRAQQRPHGRRVHGLLASQHRDSRSPGPCWVSAASTALSEERLSGPLAAAGVATSRAEPVSTNLRTGSLRASPGGRLGALRGAPSVRAPRGLESACGAELQLSAAHRPAPASQAYSTAEAPRTSAKFQACLSQMFRRMVWKILKVLPGKSGVKASCPPGSASALTFASADLSAGDRRVGRDPGAAGREAELLIVEL